MDGAIIGNGYTDLTAAPTLAKRGASVAVLESEIINGGMGLTSLKTLMQTAIKRYKRDFAQLLFQCSLNSIDTVHKLLDWIE